jgi:hypothetical protein
MFVQAGASGQVSDTVERQRAVAQQSGQMRDVQEAAAGPVKNSVKGLLIPPFAYKTRGDEPLGAVRQTNVCEPACNVFRAVKHAVIVFLTVS